MSSHRESFSACPLTSAELSLVDEEELDEWLPQPNQSEKDRLKMNQSKVLWEKNGKCFPSANSCVGLWLLQSQLAPATVLLRLRFLTAFAFPSSEENSVPLFGTWFTAEWTGPFFEKSHAQGVLSIKGESVNHSVAVPPFAVIKMKQ